VDGDCQYTTGHPHCDTDSGECQCTGDTDCQDLTNYPKCNTDIGRCICETDDNCASLDNADTCFDGVCGCSTVDVCNGTTAFDGTTYVCE
jgi:hypothetical protein